MSYTPRPQSSFRLLTEAEVAALLGKTPAAVKKARQRKAGPPHYTIGRSIRYHPRRVAEWIEQHNTEQPAR